MALDLFDVIADDRRLRVVVSERSDGDVHPRNVETDELDDRQRRMIGSRWHMASQVHGTDVIVAGDDSEWPVVGTADVVVSNSAPVGIWAADCASIILFGSSGLVVGAHGGWRGLADGVVDVAVDAVHERGDSVSAVVVGPLIHPCCYEFSGSDIATVARGVHAEPSALTGLSSTGSLALDVPAALRAAFRHRDLTPDVIGPCTGCDDGFFSHRVRSDGERHATVGWMEVSR